jgi:hypothetical protein
VKAERRVHRHLGVLVLLELEGRVTEFRHHLVLGEPAEIATRLGGAGLGRLFLGQALELRALIELLDDRLRFVLGLHQDVAGMDFVLRRVGLHELVVLGLQHRVGGLRLDGARQPDVLHDRLLRSGDLLLNFRILIELGLLGFGRDQLGRDHLVDDQRIQLFLGHLLQLRRQLRDEGVELAGVNFFAVDLGDHRTGRGRRRNRDHRRRGRPASLVSDHTRDPQTGHNGHQAADNRYDYTRTLRRHGGSETDRRARR